MALPNSEVSLENPTWEYLNSNYNKSELQKHCRKLGIPKIWVTKGKLIDLILEKHRTSQVDISENVEQETDNQDIMKCMLELRERVTVRDLEIDEFNELLKNAHITINKLNDRISSLEEQVRQLRGSATQRVTSSTPEGPPSAHLPPERTLLIGDDNLATIRVSDLDAKCSIRTIKGANIDLITSWISEKLLWVPKSCILYIGSQDINEETTAARIFDGMGSLVAALKQVNENMEIHICELAPDIRVEEFDEKINNFNNQLGTWCLNNGTSVIECNQQFRLGTGESDGMCFEKNEVSNDYFLNRFGIIRLLNVISKQCPALKLHENWDGIVSQDMNKLISQNDPNYSYPRRTENYFPRKDQSQTTSRWRRPSTSYVRHQGHHGHTHTRYRNERASGNEFERTNDHRRHHHHRGHRMPLTTEERQRTNASDRLDADRRRTRQPHLPLYSTMDEAEPRRGPCHNCGETNHLLQACRHDHRIRCIICKELGHKSRLCPYYSE